MLVRGDETVVEWVRKRLPEEVSTFGPCETMGVVDGEGKLIAAVVYSNYRKTDIELAIASESPRWAMKEHIRAILSYPFIQLGCTRITAMTDRDNDQVRKFLSRLGFMHEGTLHDASEKGDVALFGMTKRYFLRSKWYGEKERSRSGRNHTGTKRR